MPDQILSGHIILLEIINTMENYNSYKSNEGRKPHYSYRDRSGSQSGSSRYSVLGQDNGNSSNSRESSGSTGNGGFRSEQSSSSRNSGSSRGFGGDRSFGGRSSERSSGGSSYGNNGYSGGGNRRFGPRGYGSGRSFGGGGRGFGGGNNSRRRGPAAEYIDERKFIKKAQPLADAIPYVPTFKFADLDVNNILKQNILEKGYVDPTPIQDQSIYQIMEGKDLLGIANTGTGKTAAFLIPLVEKIIKDRNHKALIIVPTRELAQQINDEIYELTRNLRIYSVQCIGGASINNQLSNLRRGFSIVVGTPGRLKDLVERRALNLSLFSTVILDEVDRMLDMGFVDDIRTLISYLAPERQSLFFSATMNPQVEKIINMILKPDHIRVSVKTGETALNVDQDIIRVSCRDEKITKLKDMLISESYEKVLIFANTKREVDHLERHYFSLGIQVGSIHGDKRQRERQRAIDSFRSGRIKALIATDVAARGLDISGVTHVINYDVPNQYQDYIHRIGRTGRANKSGIALTFVGTQR